MNSYKVDTPRLRVFQFENGEKQLEPLIDSASSPITSFKYDAFKRSLVIEVVDNDGRFVKDLIRNETVIFTRKNMERHGHVLRPQDFDEGFNVSFEFLHGEEESGELFGTVERVMTLNGSEDGAVVRIVIRQGDKGHSLNPSVGATTIDGGIDFQSEFTIGTISEYKPNTAGGQEVSLNIDATLSAVEQLLALPIVSVAGGTAAIVALAQPTAFAIRNRLLQKKGMQQLQFLAHDLGFAWSPGPDGKTLKLAYGDRHPSSEEVNTLRENPTYNGFPLAVLQTIIRLNNISAKLGSSINYVCKTVSHRTWLAVMGFPSEVTTMYLITSNSIATGFTHGSQNIGYASPNAEMISRLSPKVHYERQKFKRYTKESLLTKIDNNTIFVFRSGTERANVLSLVESTEVAAADIGLIGGATSLVKKSPFTTAPTPDLPVVFNWNSVQEQYKFETVTGFTESADIIAYLREMGEVFDFTEEDRILEEINAAVELTEKRYGLERDPAALAAYLQFLSTKRAQGGEKLTIRTPLHLAYYGEETLRHFAYVQHVKSPVLDSPERHTVQATNTGLYQIFGMRHVVTANDGYTEFDLQKIGYDIKDSQISPIVGKPDTTPTELQPPSFIGAPEVEVVSSKYKYTPIGRNTRAVDVNSVTMIGKSLL